MQGFKDGKVSTNSGGTPSPDDDEIGVRSQADVTVGVNFSFPLVISERYVGHVPQCTKLSFHDNFFGHIKTGGN